jgi:hypothetical protein
MHDTYQLAVQLVHGLGATTRIEGADGSCSTVMTSPLLAAPSALKLFQLGGAISLQPMSQPDLAYCSNYDSDLEPSYGIEP